MHCIVHFLFCNLLWWAKNQVFLYYWQQYGARVWMMALKFGRDLTYISIQVRRSILDPKGSNSMFLTTFLDLLYTSWVQNYIQIRTYYNLSIYCKNIVSLMYPYFLGMYLWIFNRVISDLDRRLFLYLCFSWISVVVIWFAL